MKIKSLIFLGVLQCCIFVNAQVKTLDPVEYVNPLMGTQSSYELSNGNTYPIIGLPWGMNYWTPQTGKNGNGWQYTYDATKIRGFKQTHQPSPWMNDYGAFAIMPVTGKLKFTEDQRASWFTHKAEVSKPYYYSVYLADYDIVTEIAATMAFSATQNNDKIGLILFSDTIELYIPPKKGRSHVLRIIRELIEFEPKSNKTDLAQALKFLSGTQKKKAIVFVISDFMTQEYEQTLKIASKKHDITGIRVYDIREEKIPNLGMVPMLDAETGAIQLVDTGSKSVRMNYEKYYHDRVAYFKETFSKSGSGVVNTRVDESYVTKLLGYFKSR